MYAARIRLLGLTAYGDTQAEAQSRIVLLLQSDIHAHVKVGTVNKWLEGAGLVTIETLPDPEKR